MARPRKEINQKQFENLCGLQCTKDEICAFFDVTDKTRGLGKISLRRSQWRLAEKSATMAIWLGKQYLDQKDRIESTVDGEVTVVIDV